MVQYGDFCNLMVNILNLGTLKFGKCLKKLSDYGKEARLYFDNDSEVYADLVIDADGFRSIVRNAGCLKFSTLLFKTGGISYFC